MRKTIVWYFALMAGAGVCTIGCAGDVQEEHVGREAAELTKKPLPATMTLTLDRFEAGTPHGVLEGDPIYAWFTLTNNTTAWHSGYVEGQVFPDPGGPFGNQFGQWEVNALGPGQSVKGVVEVIAPRAGRGASIDVYYYEDYEVLGEFNTFEGSRLAQSTSLSFDVGARPAGDTIWVSPPSAPVAPGGTLQFSAADQDVHWSVDGNPATNGTIDETTGLYHAPAQLGAAPIRVRARTRDGLRNGSGFVGRDTTTQAGSEHAIWGIGGSRHDPLGALKFMAADVDGDHKTDVVQVFDNGGYLGVVTYKSNGAGLYSTWRSDYVGSWSSAEAFLTGDIDGDGDMDIIKPYSNRGALIIDTIRSESGAFYTASSAPTTQGASALAWFAGDVDGDGKAELIQVWDGGGRTGIIVYGSTSTGFAYRWGTGNAGYDSRAISWNVGDVNGDGKVDVIQTFDSGGRLGVNVYQSTGVGFAGTYSEVFPTIGSSRIRVLAGDVNGDRSTDLVTIDAFNSVGTIVGTASGMRLASHRPWVPSASSPVFLLGDVNGDRQSDILQLSNVDGRLGMTIIPSEGSSFGRSPTWWSPEPDIGQGVSSVTWLTGDVNGDGRVDVIQPWNDNGYLGFLVYAGTP